MHDGCNRSRDSADGPALEDQRRFWNEWNAAFRAPGRLNDWAERRGAAILSKVSALELDHPRIIDLGCGSGWLTERLAAFGTVVGIDLSDEVIAAARARAPHIEYIAGDLFAAPLPDAHFDLVVSQDVIAHVVDQRAYATRAARLLKPGGYLVITTTNRFVVERMDLPPQPPEHIERWLSRRLLRDLLAPHFAVLEMSTVMPAGSKGVLRIINSPRLGAVVGALISPRRLDALKERMGLGYNILAVARKLR